MNSYLLVKWLHIVSSVVLVGTGLGTAYFMFFTNRSGNVQAQAVVTRLVVRADNWFTWPAVLLQPATGLWLVLHTGFELRSFWLASAIGLYLLAGACWLPVLWLQRQMRDLAAAAARNGEALPPRYWRHARCWEVLGVPAFLAMLVVFYLMVAKPG